jgi:acetate kinase
MAQASVLAVNSGSSSVKFALFTADAEPVPVLRGTIEVTDRRTVAEQLIERVAPALSSRPLAAIGHRLVHGGPHYVEPQIVTRGLLDALTRLIPFAPNHLPDEIGLIESLGRLRPELPQVACFDTAFHRDLPEVARRLPIPAEYESSGVRRYGFHGLSYGFLLQQLDRSAGPDAAGGRVVMAHLGNGSSLAAVQAGKCIDTSMGFTPIGGVVMSTRTGDLDPGVVTYLARTEGLSADAVEELLSQRCGLVGVSGVSGDMRDLLAREATEPASRLAVAMYCYEIKKRIGSYAAALGGIETLVFSGGIGEHAPVVRSRICSGLAFLGIVLDESLNRANAPLISDRRSRAGVQVRVIPTDEEMMIARAIHETLQ